MRRPHGEPAARQSAGDASPIEMPVSGGEHPDGDDAAEVRRGASSGWSRVHCPASRGRAHDRVSRAGATLADDTREG